MGNLLIQMMFGDIAGYFFGNKLFVAWVFIFYEGADVGARNIWRHFIKDYGIAVSYEVRGYLASGSSYDGKCFIRRFFPDFHITIKPDELSTPYIRLSPYFSEYILGLSPLRIIELIGNKPDRNANFCL